MIKEKEETEFNPQVSLSENESGEVKESANTGSAEDKTSPEQTEEISSEVEKEELALTEITHQTEEITGTEVELKENEKADKQEENVTGVIEQVVDKVPLSAFEVKQEEELNSGLVHEEIISTEKTALTEEMKDQQAEIEPEAHLNLSNTEHHEEDHHEHLELELSVDYSHFTKADFTGALKNLTKENNLKKITLALKDIRHHFDELIAAEKIQALAKFEEEGGHKDDFEFKEDEETKNFYAFYQQIQLIRNKLISENEKQKEGNLAKKNELLDRLRHLTDAEESQASINELKKIQEEWRNIGPVNPQHNRSLWASYNALIELFYNQRSIYFELKELDRRKNLAQKLILIERAEKLSDYESIQQAIRELNEIHDEFKHIGPVPKEEQDALWSRLKNASDKVYEKRKEYLKNQEIIKKKNLEEKFALCVQLDEFVNFTSDKIALWNAKTKEILNLQKKWEAIRFIPGENIKEAGKKFWVPFKTFFSNKNAFIKTLDDEREANLKLKEAILKEAQELVNAQEENRKIADKLKGLQRKWKEIGPVPNRYRKNIYEEFKNVCDSYFNRRREKIATQEKTFEDNLQKKEELCQKINEFDVATLSGAEMVKFFLDEWHAIGYVPKEKKEDIQKAFLDSLEKMVEKIPKISEDEREKLMITVELTLYKDNPKALSRLQQKESVIRKQIQRLENDIDTLNNNLGFFAKSKQVNQLKESVEKQIQEATEKLKSLKRKLKIFQNI